MELIETEARELADDPFTPWILEIDGKRVLPAFSSQKKMEVFSGEISQRMNRVFALGCGDVLILDIAKDLQIDVIALNLLNKESWEIGVQ
jgi:hypothetical protein